MLAQRRSENITKYVSHIWLTNDAADYQRCARSPLRRVGGKEERLSHVYRQRSLLEKTISLARSLASPSIPSRGGRAVPSVPLINMPRKPERRRERLISHRAKEGRTERAPRWSPAIGRPERAGRNLIEPPTSALSTIPTCTLCVYSRMRMRNKCVSRIRARCFARRYDFISGARIHALGYGMYIMTWRSLYLWWGGGGKAGLVRVSTETEYPYYHS